MTFSKEQQEVMREALSTYGFDAQCDIAIEEMSELTKAIIKYRRYGTVEEYTNMCEEIADVAIMIEQLWLSTKNIEVGRFIVEKLDRLEKRLSEAKESAEPMTDKEIIKKKIKAIYPHIVVSGDVDKPYYSIHWYDIEKKTMICGYSSYNLEFVRKWLQEEFEVIESDIDNLINQQEADIERLQEEVRNKDSAMLEIFEIKRFFEQIASVKSIKEFADRLCEGRLSNDPVVIAVKAELKETAGADNA